MSETWRHHFEIILDKIISKKESEIFREPVNYESLGFFDYPQIVKHPMDLGTVTEESQTYNL